MSDTDRDACLGIAHELWPRLEIVPETVRNGKRSGRAVLLVAPALRRRELARANSWRLLRGELKRALAVRVALTRVTDHRR